MTVGYFHIGFVSGVVPDRGVSVQRAMWIIINKRVCPVFYKEFKFEDTFRFLGEDLALQIGEEVRWSWDMNGGCKRFQFEATTTLEQALQYARTQYEESASRCLCFSTVPPTSGTMYESITRHDAEAYEALARVPRWYEDE